MTFDFDTVIDRSGGDSSKWNRYAPGVLPLWVADMDFAAPPAVLEALARRLDHGVFGYGEAWPSLVSAVIGHLAQEYDWVVDPDWLLWLPGLVTGLNVACRAVGESGSAVFTSTPIYPPFLSAPKNSQRRVVSAPLKLVAGRWQWDFAAVEAALVPATKLFLLCHPHNPVGRAWHEDELREIAAIARRHDLVVCSDEIHCGLILEPGRRHRPFAAQDADAARRSITLMAPSKTFNIPGLGCAFAVIPDAALRRAFAAAMQGIVPHVNVFGLAATEAAYRHCDAWHTALLDYLRGNRARVHAVIAALPGLAMTPVEATYLAWIDAREFSRIMGVADPRRCFEAAGVGLSAGEDFGGDAYRGYVRLNFGCPRAILDAALARIAAAVKS
ncbi:MAG TPA: PatB family C-S lyase [Rhodocyclaceae bacterium]|nr:PatB family C-S lyase [Rhodocyclaceae bacterium]